METTNTIAYFQQRVAEEESKAYTTATPEASEAHAQTAMLYKVQLAMLKRAYQAEAGLTGQVAGRGSVHETPIQ